MSPEETLQHLQAMLEQKRQHEESRAKATRQAQLRQALFQAATGAGAFALMGALDPAGTKQKLLRIAEQVAQQCLQGEPPSLPPMYQPLAGDIQAKDAEFEIVEEEP